MWRPLDIVEWKGKRRAGLDDVRTSVAEIISMVRNGGDRSLRDLTVRFDKVQLQDIAISKEVRQRALKETDQKLIADLRSAAERIRRFHEMQIKNASWMKEVEPGIHLGVKLTPLRRIGAYVPGGRASYPSTALMCVIPAKVAGVKEVVCCTPPPVNPLTLAALEIAGVDEVYQLGGAQAIAAMALGTESIRPVQKIVGPGNVYVTAAKMLLREYAEIDFPAGPSEVAIIADSSANPDFVASDILAQAEHDPRSACILITTDADVADKVGAAMEMMLRTAARGDILSRSMENTGYVIAKDLEEAAAISDEVAPEHLSIQTREPLKVLEKVHNAGSIFIGPYAPVACGDYASGTNHVLPTAGYAALFSGLDTRHFCKTSSVQMLDKQGLERIADVVESLAEAEGLKAHAGSIRIRRTG